MDDYRKKIGCLVYISSHNSIYRMNAKGFSILTKLKKQISLDHFKRLQTRQEYFDLINLLSTLDCFNISNNNVTLSSKVHIYPISEAFPYPEVPISVLLEVTTKCNLRCFYCCVPQENYSKSSDMNSEQFLKLVKRLVETGVGKITFTGGEPLLREKIYHDLFDAIKIASSSGLRTILFTNGTLISYYIEEIVQCGLSTVQISLDTTDPILYEKITGKNMLNNVEKGVTELCKKDKIIVNLAMVINQENYKVWKSLIEFARKVGANGIEFLRIAETGRVCNVRNNMLINPEKWNGIKKEIIEFARENDINYSDDANARERSEGKCKGGTTYCVINSNGSVSPCPIFKWRDLTLGNLLEEDILTLWRKNNWQSYRNSKMICPGFSPEGNWIFLKIN